MATNSKALLVPVSYAIYQHYRCQSKRQHVDLMIGFVKDFWFLIVLSVVDNFIYHG
ncbi:MAG: hypothetical protein ACI8RD_001212 [Bacillariaceae sp.]|jgi:hypothetical protein